MLVAPRRNVFSLVVPDPGAVPGTAGTNLDGEPVRELLDHVPAEEAHTFEFETEAHCAAYDVLDAEGAPLGQACRLKKESLPRLVAMGARVVCSAVLLDYDHPGPPGVKTPWDKSGTTWEELLARLPQHPSLAYATRHGARFLFRLSEPVAAGRQFEALVADFHRRFAAAGVAVDPKCSDWTRLYKLPRVTHEDGSRSWEQPWYREEFDPDEFHVPAPEFLAELTPEPSAPSPSATVQADDDQCLVLLQSPEVLRVERNTRGTRWHDAVWNARPFAVSGRHNALTELVGFFCRETREAGGSVDHAYAVCREATKYVDQEGHDWRAECSEMVRAFWSRDSTAVPPPAPVSALTPLPEHVPDPTAAPEDVELLERDGRVVASLANMRLAFRRLRVEVWLDEFACDRMVRLGDEEPRHLDDQTENHLWCVCEEQLRFAVGREKFSQWLDEMAYESRRHPLRQYLSGLKWDGTPRVDSWLARYAGVESSDYTRAVGRIFLVAAVRRAFHPGALYQEMLLLEGDQGRGKSSLLQTLAVRREWFTDEITLGVGGREVLEQTLGKWIVESGELVGLRANQVQELKAFLSRDVDQGRLSYDRRTTKRPRQFVIAGTTNSDKYLLDWTGNRRFWAVRTGEIDLAALRADLDQLWAEAVALEAAGEPIRLDPSLYPVATAEQEERRVEDPFEEPLATAFAQWQDARGTRIRVEDVWTLLGIPVERRTHRDTQRVAAAMKRAGWSKKNARIGGRIFSCFVRHEGLVELTVRRAGSTAKVAEVKQ